MADRLSRNAPYQIMEVDVHQINDVLRQIQQAVDELRGLQGPVTIHDTITFSESIVLADGQYATTTEIANVAATESAGTSETLARGDHVHAHDAGYLPDAHHDQVHAIDGADHTGQLDASEITYTPVDTGDWSGSTDPGETDDALDQLADRVTAVEASVGISVNKDTDFADAPDTDQIWEKVIAGSNITITELANGEVIEIASTGGGVTDAADLTYTPAVLADWDSSIDPGDADEAFDQLAERVTDLEAVPPGSYDGTLASNLNEFIEAPSTTQPWEKVLAGSNITITEVGNGEAISIAASGSGAGGLLDYEYLALAADQTWTSDTAFADLTSFNLSVSANETWVIDWLLVYNGSTGGDIKFTATHPAGWAVTYYSFGPATNWGSDASEGSLRSQVLSGGSGAIGGAFGNNKGGASNNPNSALIKVRVVADGTAGTLQFQAAQLASSVTATTVYGASGSFPGTFYEAKRVA